MVNLNKNFWKNKRILITGHTGFKGSWLSIILKELGCKVYHLGQKAVLLNPTPPTKKEISISHFKEGFAGFTYAQPHLEVHLGS